MLKVHVIVKLYAMRKKPDWKLCIASLGLKQISNKWMKAQKRCLALILVKNFATNLVLTWYQLYNSFWITIKYQKTPRIDACCVSRKPVFWTIVAGQRLLNKRSNRKKYNKTQANNLYENYTHSMRVVRVWLLLTNRSFCFFVHLSCWWIFGHTFSRTSTTVRVQ